MDCVKTGMLATPEIVETVAAKLREYRVPNVVVDTVMVAKGGAKLLVDEAVQMVKSKLLPLATVITPNLPETACLLGTTEVPDGPMRARTGAGRALFSGYFSFFPVRKRRPPTAVGSPPSVVRCPSIAVQLCVFPLRSAVPLSSYCATTFFHPSLPTPFTSVWLPHRNTSQTRG